MKGEPLDIKSHQRHGINGNRDAKELRNSRELIQLSQIKRGVNKSSAQQMDQTCKSGASLTLMSSFMDDTELSSQEFRYNVCWRLGLTPRCLPIDCDGCRAPSLAEHAYQSKVGGLINLCHNILADDWGDLYAKSFTPSAVSDKPIIHTGSQLIGEEAIRAKEEETEQATQARIIRG